MSRLQHAEPILQAAEQWKQQCLLANGSIFSTEQLWTGEHFGTLRSCYVDKTVDTKGSFIETVKDKIAPEPPHIKRLWAEIAWVYYLFPTSTKTQTKRDRIMSYWRWSGTELAPDHMALSDSTLAGIGGAGAAYNTHAWLEFRFLVTMLEDWYRETADQKQALMADAWRYADWLESREHVAARMLRHVILYLLFPDFFEPIATGIDKRQIVSVLHPERDSFDYKDRVAIDRAILDVREQLEAQFPNQEVNFYRSPAEDLWKPDARKPTSSDVSDATATSMDDATTWFRQRFPDSTRVWWLSTGTGGHLWSDSVRSKVAVLSHGDLGDLVEYETREQVIQDLIDLGHGPRPWHESLALWQFSREIAVNDVIIAHSGGSKVYGWGLVTGEYSFEPDRPAYPHTRTVEWYPCRPNALEVPRSTAKSLTDFRPHLPFVQRVFRTIEQGPGPGTPLSDPEYDIEMALDGLFIHREQFNRILESIRLRKNLILQGPPGTGKTFIARRIAFCLIGRRDNTHVQMVQFHQSYSYEDFVQGFRPDDSGGFALKNGVFFKFCLRARESPTEQFVFVIDEINRGNMSRIFGELLMLIEADKRNSDYAVPLTYESDREPFFVPPNVYILGMMNTADRSIAMVDYALRRRFAFEDLRPAYGSEQFREYLSAIDLDQSLINQIDERMRQLNDEIQNDSELGPGFRIGHSFFVPGEDDELTDDWYQHVVRTQIQPLLQEYWFDAPERVEGAVNRLLAP